MNGSYFTLPSSVDTGAVSTTTRLAPRVPTMALRRAVEACLMVLVVAMWGQVPGTESHRITSPGENDMTCVERAPMTTPDGQPKDAYFIMIGPFTMRRAYRTWLYAAVALHNALKRSGSTADTVILCALKDQKGVTSAYMLPEEEELLQRNDVHWRYVHAPYGNSGFHMGHYKLWAWQHTEYARIQLLDADVIPLVNMDAYFRLAEELQTDFLGCPGKISVLNAGWFVLRPSCAHFDAMTRLVMHDNGRWNKVLGWGHELDTWKSATGAMMPPGWDFFDAHGNQGHMYSYFMFDAKDITLIYKQSVLRHTTGSTTEASDISRTPSQGGSYPAHSVAKMNDLIASAYPCPFPKVTSGSAYYHFTGNVKPWTKYKPTDKAFALWYKAAEASGIDVQETFFSGSGG